MNRDTRKRLVLVGIVALFAAPVAIAYVLLHGFDWRPVATRNSGTLVEPARDLRATRLELDDGTLLAWKDPPDWHWTLLGLPGPGCAQRCLAKLDELRRERLTLNRNADRLRVVVVDRQLPAATLDSLKPLMRARDPDQALAALRARSRDGVAAALVDPNGFLILLYAEGYDGNGMRKDLARLIK